MAPTRRDVLRTGGVAALLSSGLAGCVEDLSDTPGENRPAYTDWLFDTDALFEASFRGFYSASVAEYREQKAALPEDFRKAVEGQVDRYDGIELSDFDRVTGLGAFADPDPEEYGDEQYLTTSVLTGEFDTAAVRETLETETSLSAAGEYEGYDLYTYRSEYDFSDTQAAAVGEEAVVLTLAQAGGSSGANYRDDRTPSGTPKGGVTAQKAAELHIDAAAGEVDRLAPASDRLDTLVTALDGAAVGGLALDDELLRRRTGMGVEPSTPTPMTDGPGRATPDDGPGETTTPDDGPATPTVSEPDPSAIQRHLRRTTLDLQAFGASADAAGGSGEVVVRLQYDTDDDAANGADAVRDLREALRKQVEALTVPDVSVETDGATVVVTINGDPTAFYEKLREGTERPESRAPQVSFSFEKREDGRVTVTHDGGDEVGVDGTIGLLYESEDGGVDRAWEPDDGSITAGDSITTERPVTGMLRVIWTAEDGDASATLGLYRPPAENPRAPPEVSFDYDLRDGNRVTITHAGGDVVERTLVVRYDGGGAEKWAEDDGRIEAGDSYTTRDALAEDGSLQVVWPGEEEPVVIGDFTTAPTATPRETRTATGEETPTRTETATPDDTPTRTSEPTETATPSGSETPTRTETATPSETETATSTETSTSTGTSTSTPTGTSDPTPRPRTRTGSN